VFKSLICTPPLSGEPYGTISFLSCFINSSKFSQQQICAYWLTGFFSEGKPCVYQHSKFCPRYGITISAAISRVILPLDCSQTSQAIVSEDIHSRTHLSPPHVTVPHCPALRSIGPGTRRRTTAKSAKNDRTHFSSSSRYADVWGSPFECPESYMDVSRHVLKCLRPERITPKT
jgi:hypothetical protein